MKNTKVLLFTSLLAVATLAGCGAKTSSKVDDGVPTSMIIPEASQTEAVENDNATYPDELLVNHKVAAMIVGDTFQLEAAEQFKYDGKNVKFEVKDPTVASIDENGLITGLAGGETEIVVTDKANPDFKTTVPVIVYAELGSASVTGVTNGLKTYENANPVTEVIQYKRLAKSISRRPVKQNENDPDQEFVQLSYDLSDEMMVFSTNDAYLRILETDAEVRTTDGAMDFTSYDWIFCTNKYYDTLVYHQVGDAKTFYAAPTQDYMDGERSAPLYDILDNLFTVGHTFFLDQLDNANFKNVIDIAEDDDIDFIEGKRLGSLGDGSLFCRGVLMFKDSTADNDDERQDGIPVGTPTPTTQDSTWIVKDNKVVGLYYYLVQDYVIDGYEYRKIMDIDIKLEEISADRHEIYLPAKEGYQKVDRLFEI